MKNYRFLILLSALLTTLPTSAALSLPAPSRPALVSQASETLPLSQMGIGRIKLGLNGAQVRRVLGKPLQAKQETARCCGILYTWRYSDLELKLVDWDSTGNLQKMSVYEVSTKRSKSATVDGVRVGDRRSKVLQVYGTPGETDDKNPNVLYYSNSKLASFIVFKLKNDRVVEIMAHSLLV